MIGCFGKVPASADFISLHGAAPEVREFDRWLQTWLAPPAQGGDWRAAFDRLPVHFFCYRGRSGNWLLGGMISSRDSSERRYPFMIFQLLKASVMSPLVNPFTLCELFWSQIKPLLHLAVQNESVSGLFGRINALRSLEAQDVKLFERVHEKFLQNLSFDDIRKSLEPAYPEYVPGVALGRLRDLRAHWHSDSDVAVSLPLPAERAFKNPVADLWITWLNRLGQRLPVLSLLADDFIRPRLICFASRNTSGGYYGLTGAVDHDEHYDVLAPCGEIHGRNRPATWPDQHLPLSTFIDQFVDTLDVKSK